jgi:hypothetical protein
MELVSGGYKTCNLKWSSEGQSTVTAVAVLCIANWTSKGTDGDYCSELRRAERISQVERNKRTVHSDENVSSRKPPSDVK